MNDISLREESFNPMMDPLWGLKCRQNEHNTVDNPDHATAKNYHRSLKSNIYNISSREEDWVNLTADGRISWERKSSCTSNLDEEVERW